MNEKVVLITGAGSGIGFATAKIFLNANYCVLAHFNQADENLKSLKSKNLYPIKADFSVTENIEDFYQTCFKIRERIDILVNNAASFRIAPSLTEITSEHFDEIMNINLKTPFILSQLALKSMSQNKWGRIINISSIGVKYGGNPCSSVYTLSKAALEAMTKSFAKAGAPHNILVNAIRVGVTNTEFHTKNQSKNLEERAEMIPLKRLALPEEIAESIFFLASEKSNFTTGTILTVAGGE